MNLRIGRRLEAGHHSESYIYTYVYSVLFTYPVDNENTLIETVV
jgi:hypothetical protein